MSMANHANDHDETVLEFGDNTEGITPAEQEIMDGADNHLDTNSTEGAKSTAGTTTDSIDAARRHMMTPQFTPSTSRLLRWLVLMESQ